MMKHFNKSELSNGIRVLSETQPDSRAISIGIWITTGTRDESEDMVGISHFLEHMVFKGTKTRSAFKISESLEKLGGELNAYTTREYTCYHALVLRDHWKVALEVLSDLVCNMQMRSKDFNLERSVILQELAMSEDNHEDIIYDYLFEDIYGKHPLGAPILGTAKSLAEMNLKKVNAYYQNTYQGQNIIVSVSGDIDHHQFVAETQKFLGKKKKKVLPQTRRAPRWKVKNRFVDKEIEQTHLLLGMPATSFKSRDRFEAVLLNTILGGGMTSMLYQSIRERRGLAYAVFSGLTSHVDSGLVTVYAGVEPKKVLQTRDVILKTMETLKKKAVSEKQLETFKTQIMGNILLGVDDVENRMTSLAVNEMVFGHYRPVEKVIEEIEAVSIQSFKEYLRDHFNLDQISWVVLGPEASKLESKI